MTDDVDPYRPYRSGETQWLKAPPRVLIPEDGELKDGTVLFMPSPEPGNRTKNGMLVYPNRLFMLCWSNMKDCWEIIETPFDVAERFDQARLNALYEKNLERLRKGIP